MSTPNVPFKTSLGHDELRLRTHRLSQRHRTILLLVDGRRPLAEVLGLAQKAGSSISHFEDVLKLGLVELPIDVVAPDPVMTEPGALPTLRTTSVEVAVEAADSARVPLDGLDEAHVEPLPLMTVQTADDDDDALARGGATTEAGALLPAALMGHLAHEVPGAPVATKPPAAPTLQDEVPPTVRVETPARRDEERVGGEPQDAPATTELEAPPVTASAPRAPEAPPAPSKAAAPVRAAAAESAADVPVAADVSVPVAAPRGADAVPVATDLPVAAAAPPGRAPEVPAFPPPPRAPADTRVVPATQRRRAGRLAAKGRAATESPPELCEPVTLAELAHVPPAELPLPTPPMPDGAMVEQVRELLAQTVRQNPPPFVSRVPGRVAAARTLQELRDLVLDIERYLSARRPRAGAPGLQHARELLGLGNTVVAEDSRSWRDEDDDDDMDAFRTTR